MILNSSDHNGLKPANIARYIIPSSVSVGRVLLAILLVKEMSDWPDGILVAALFGVPIVITLDAVDGILARHLKSQTLVGSFIDIAADRAVEFIFLQYLVRAGLIPLWFVLVFYGRILLTDACRLRAFGMEKVSATGILLPLPWRSLVLAKWSRSTYGALKGLLFSLLLLTIYRGNTLLALPEFGVMLGVLAFSILRAVPILITYFPRGKDPITAPIQNSNYPHIHDIATRTTIVASCVQLASDFCLTVILVVLAQH